MSAIIENKSRLETKVAECTTSPVVLYTATGKEVITLISILASNYSGSSQTCTITHNNGTAFAYKFTVGANDVYTLMAEENSPILRLEDGDTLSIESNANTAINVWLTISTAAARRTTGTHALS